VIVYVAKTWLYECW